MVRRNLLRRPTYRVKRYRRKNQPFAISIRFKEYLDLMSINVEKWLILLDLLEKQVMKTLQIYNIPTHQWVGYISHAKECLKKATRFNFTSLLNEILIGIQKWLLRLYDYGILIKISNEGIEKAKRDILVGLLKNIHLYRNIFSYSISIEIPKKLKFEKISVIRTYLNIKSHIVLKLRVEKVIKPKIEFNVFVKTEKLIKAFYPNFKPKIKIYYKPPIKKFLLPRFKPKLKIFAIYKLPITKQLTFKPKIRIFSTYKLPITKILRFKPKIKIISYIVMKIESLAIFKPYINIYSFFEFPPMIWHYYIITLNPYREIYYFSHILIRAYVIIKPTTSTRFKPKVKIYCNVRKR